MWVRVAAILLVGYLTLSRTFAYLGVPAWNAYISEVALALLLLAGPVYKHRSWLKIALKQSSLKPLWISYGLFLAYGIFEVGHGIAAGYPPLLALRDLTFNYYPLYLFLGLWAGIRRPDLLPRLLRGFAWFNGIYGALYLLFLCRIDWSMPGVSSDVTPVSFLPQPIYSFVALLGLITYEKSFRRIWHVFLLNAFVMLGMQFRTEWLAFAVGACVWACLTRQPRRVLQAAGVMLGLIALMYITDFTLPSPALRSEEAISGREIVNRAIAPFRADLSDSQAAAGAPDTTATVEEATAIWRTVWWFSIWTTVHERTSTALLGEGYGYPLGDLVPYLAGEFIRTPHNVLFYALGYTGWLGVITLLLFQLQLFLLLWRGYRGTRQAFGVAYWAAMMAFSMFFPLFETPYGAIPFYLIMGWVIGRVVLMQAVTRRNSALQPIRSGPVIVPGTAPQWAGTGGD